MAISVVIYDDNKSRQESLSLLVESDPDLKLLGAKHDCSSVIDDMIKYMPDVVLMDIQMPGVNGIEGVRLIHSNFPQIRVIMQTVFEDDDMVFDSIRYGASGYILKKTPPHKVIEAIKDVIQGGSPITPSIASKVLKFFQNQTVTIPNDTNIYQLTEREKEILQLLTDGLSYKMIAEECKISIYTVNAHTRKIYEKLHVNSATAAIAIAHKIWPNGTKPT